MPMNGGKKLVRYASLYSGIGGMELGFGSTGAVDVAWQCESDVFRQQVLKRQFNAILYDRVETVPVNVAPVDVLFAELPDWRIDVWWPPVARVLQTIKPLWFLCEFSPTVRFEGIIRDLALATWSFRVLQVRVRVEAVGMRPEHWDRRQRGMIIASTSAEAVDTIGLSGMSVDAIVHDVSVAGFPVGSPEWQEVSRGIPAGWTCVCGHPGPQCKCPEVKRSAAIRDASSPHVGRWLYALLTGGWSDGKTRGLTKADGGAHGTAEEGSDKTSVLAP